MFLPVNSGGKIPGTVFGVDGDGGLDQDRSGVDLLIHKVRRAAADGDPGGQGLADGVHPFETGQQRWMDVDDPGWKGLQKNGCHDPHPPGHHHHVDRRLPEGADQGEVELFPAGMQAVIQAETGDPQPLGAAAGPAGRVVHHQQLHSAPQVPATAGFHQGFEVAAAAGGHHPEAQVGVMQRRGRCQWPLDGLRKTARFVVSGH